MIWKSWGQSDLQEALEAQSAGLLDRLEGILPRVAPGKLDRDSVYEKRTLVRVLAAFADSSYFSRKKNLEVCLDRISLDTMKELSEALSLDSSLAFEVQKASIVSHGWKDRKFSESFLKFFDLPGHFLPEQVERRPSAVPLIAASPTSPVQVTSAYKPLLSYQSGIYYRTIEDLEPPKARLILQMPTGSGKTRTAMEVIASVLNSKLGSPVVIWLAHSEELCEQAFQCFLDVWPHVAKRDLHAYRAWGEHGMPPAYEHAMFIVAGLQKTWSSIKGTGREEHVLAGRTQLLVIDEAHIAVAPTYRAVLKSLLGEETRLIGLTATPGRADEEEIGKLAEIFFGNRLELPSPASGTVVSDLQKRGILAHVVPTPLHTNARFVLTNAEISRLERDLDYPAGFLARVGDDDVRNLEIIRRLLLVCGEGKQVLFFACSVDHSRFVCALLSFFGVSAAHVDGKTAKPRRREIVDGFVGEEIQVVCNFGVLTTGFDAPKTDVIFIARPTQSPVLYSQMLGRGMRGPVIGGKPKCELIDVRDNIEGFGAQEDLYERFDDYWS